MIYIILVCMEIKKGQKNDLSHVVQYIDLFSNQILNLFENLNEEND